MANVDLDPTNPSRSTLSSHVMAIVDLARDRPAGLPGPQYWSRHDAHGEGGRPAVYAASLSGSTPR
jgi:hypothetical protein